MLISSPTPDRGSPLPLSFSFEGALTPVMRRRKFKLRKGEPKAAPSEGQTAGMLETGRFSGRPSMHFGLGIKDNWLRPPTPLKGTQTKNPREANTRGGSVQPMHGVKWDVINQQIRLVLRFAEAIRAICDPTSYEKIASVDFFPKKYAISSSTRRVANYLASKLQRTQKPTYLCHVASTYVIILSNS